MPRLVILSAALVALVCATLPGSSQTASTFEKKAYNYAEWTTGPICKVAQFCILY